MDEINRKRLEWMAGNPVHELFPVELFNTDEYHNGWGPAVTEAVKAALDEIAEHEQTFDLHWKADMRGVALWRAEKPGRDLTLPDQGSLVAWLLGQIPQWQPIATAPVEPWTRELPGYYRFRCLLQNERGEVCEGWGYYIAPLRHKNGRAHLRWANHVGLCQPKYWMPLPAPFSEPSNEPFNEESKT